MSIGSSLKVESRVKKIQTGKRTFAQKVALAQRIGNRTKINNLLKSAEKIETELIKLNKRIAHTKEGTLKRRELVNLILRRNSQRSDLLLEASELHKANQKK